MVNSVVPKFVSGLQKKIASLTSENEALKTRVQNPEEAADKAEQYSLRNCIRVSGILKRDGEGTDKIIMDLAEVLQSDVSLAEIDRSHRVGKPKPDVKGSHSGKRDIIIKFTSYRSRQKLCRKRVDAKKCGYQGTFINVDLTRTRSHILCATTAQ